jgi:hypothetical protein
MADVKQQDIRADRNEPAPQELPERELDQVAGGGGRKAGKGQQEYLVVKLEDLLVSSV